MVWNKTVYMYKNGFGLNNLEWLMCHKTKQNHQCSPKNQASSGHWKILYEENWISSKTLTVDLEIEIILINSHTCLNYSQILPPNQ